MMLQRLTPTLTTAFVASLLAASAQAQAQAQTYTYKELAKPSGTSNCFLQGKLTSKGDVVGTCEQVGGVAFGLPSGNGTSILGVLVAWTYNKPVVWRGGGAPTVLSMAAKNTAAQMWTAQENGDVLGVTAKYGSRGAILGPYVNTLWRGNTRTTWSMPTSEGMLDGRVNAAGTWLLTNAYYNNSYDNPRPPKLAVVVKGVTQVLPPLPATGLSYSHHGMAFNDLGQVAISYDVKTSDTTWSEENWFWDGHSWQRMTLPPNESVMTLDALNNQGLLTGKASPYDRFIWSTTEGFVKLSTGREGQMSYGMAGAMNDQGHIVTAFSDGTSPWMKAAIWVNRQLINLNDRVTLPANWVLIEALGINAKGQILTRARDITKDGPNATKYMLLTPK